MSFKPIPKHLLIHQVDYYPPKGEGDGSMGGGPTGGPTTIKRVRFEPTRKKITTADNSEKFTTGILFIDRVNSEPFINPAEDGTMIFRGRQLMILQVNEVYTDQDEPHHLEVMLQ